MSHGLPFPHRPDQLTNAFLSDALGAPVAGFESMVIGAESGMLGSLVRLDVTYVTEPEHAPARLVAKFSAERAGSLDSARRGGTHERELRYYDELDQRTPCRAPEIFASWYDPETARFLLLQECIDGDPSVDQLRGLDLDRAKMVSRELARLHETWRESTELDECDWLPRVHGPQRQNNLGTLAEKGWPALAELLGEIDPRWSAVGETLKQRVLNLLDELSVLPATLLHGDIRVDNLLFEEDGVVLIDWQGICVGPPGFELAYFISQASTEVGGAAFEEALLDEYFAELSRLGSTASRDLVMKGYASSLLYGLVIACAIPIINDSGEERADRLARSMAKRAFAALERHGRL